MPVSVTAEDARFDRHKGVVELQERAWGGARPEPAVRRRAIDPARIVDLINELFKARFAEAVDFNDSVPFAIRNGDVLTSGS
jgi:hypothetical protein